MDFTYYLPEIIFSVILAVALIWGILYLLTSFWTYILMGTKMQSYIRVVNTILPIFMGIFTGWFQRWYPKKIARGEK